MFMKITDAQALDPNITQADVDTLEQTVRGITNNHFHVPVTRRSFVGKGLEVVFAPNTLTLPNQNGQPLQGTSDLLKYLHIGDTLEISGTGANDGVFEITALSTFQITVRMPDNFPEFYAGAFDASLVKVFYPLDIIGGVKKLIEYDVNMSGRVGVKQETVSRLSVTYFDMTAAESEGGYPRSLMTFLARHRQFNWE